MVDTGESAVEGSAADAEAACGEHPIAAGFPQRGQQLLVRIGVGYGLGGQRRDGFEDLRGQILGRDGLAAAEYGGDLYGAFVLAYVSRPPVLEASGSC